MYSPSSTSGASCLLPKLPELTDAETAEWQSLSAESDPVLLDEAKLRFGRRLEQEGKFQAAAADFAGLIAGASNAAIRDQAQGELDVLQGSGSFGARFQLQGGQILRELLKPEPILLMAAGSMAFRLGKLATLGKLASIPEAGWLSRGFGLRAAANTAGWLTETSAITLGSLALESAAGRPVSAGVLAKNFASTGLLLGSLRLMGHAAGLFASPATRSLAQQTGMYGGILLADRIETKLGFKTEAAGANPWSSAFLTWAQFNAGGVIAHGVLGEGFRSFENKLELATSSLESPPDTGQTLPGPRLAVATGQSLETNENFPSRLVDFLAASLTKGGSAGTYPREARFNLLYESPREATLEDLAFWARELNAEPSNPRRSLEAMLILHRIEGSQAKNPGDIAKGFEIVQREIAKLTLKQIEAINQLLEQEYEDGKPIVHGLILLEQVATLSLHSTARRKAYSLREQFDARFERDINDSDKWRKIPREQQFENLEAAAKLGDEVGVMRWAAALVDSAAMLRRMGTHPNAIVRQFVFSHLDLPSLTTEHCLDVWSQGERQRIVADIQSGELLRSSKALDILQFFSSHGVVAAYPLYQKFLDHVTGIGPLSPEAIAAEATAKEADTEFPYPHEERRKALLDNPSQATLVDATYWCGALRKATSAQDMADALKVLHIMDELFDGKSTESTLARQQLQNAIAKISPAQLDQFASFLEQDYLSGSPTTHGSWFFYRALRRYPDMNIRRHAKALSTALMELIVENSIENLGDPAPPKLAGVDLTTAWKRLEDAAQMEDGDRVKDWIAVILQNQRLEPKDRDPTLKTLLRHPNSFVRLSLLLGMLEGYIPKMDLRQLWADGEKGRILNDFQVSKGRSELAGHILEILADHVPEAASMLKRYGDNLYSRKKVKPEDLN